MPGPCSRLITYEPGKLVSLKPQIPILWNGISETVALRIKMNCEMNISYTPGTVSTSLHVLFNPFTGRHVLIIIPILQMWKLKHRGLNNLPKVLHLCLCSWPPSSAAPLLPLPPMGPYHPWALTLTPSGSGGLKNPECLEFYKGTHLYIYVHSSTVDSSQNVQITQASING